MKKENFKHTPGPWDEKIAQPGTMLEIVGENREYVCSLLGNDEHKKANARLIAAAPELLSVCKWVLQEIEWNHDMTASAAILKQIIKKALGE